MDAPITHDLMYFLYHYFVEWHPAVILYSMGKQYNPDDVNTGVWLATAVFGIAVWFGAARVFAEIPGRRHGNMILWWAIFAGLHIWAIPIYVIYDIVVTSTHKHYQAKMQTKYADRAMFKSSRSSKDDKFKHIPRDIK